jgi:GNAT acetyltransferase-like protein
VSSFELRAYEPEQKTDYLALLREAWGPGSMSQPEFEWWFERNPAGSLMSVAVAEERVVGVAAHSLYRMVLDGEERLASFSVHATTHASARSQGIFARLEEKHEREATEREVAVTLAFASPPTAPIFLGSLGWTEIARLRVWARPLLRQGPPTMPASLAVDGDAASGWPSHIVRDEPYLAWRYLDSPRGYEVLRSPGGYAVLWPAKRHRGRVVSILADLVAPPDEVRGLLRQAVRRSRGRALFALPAAGQRAAFASLGFVPAPQSLHFIGKALAGRLNPDPRAWRFTLGDTDFF